MRAYTDLASNLLGGLLCLKCCTAISSIAAAAGPQPQTLHRAAEARNVCLLHRILQVKGAEPLNTLHLLHLPAFVKLPLQSVQQPGDSKAPAAAAQSTRQRDSTCTARE